jgi:hypothetical protein
MTVQDGSFTPVGERLAGPGGGAAVAASEVDRNRAASKGSLSRET